MSFWCHRLDKKNNEIFSRISALASKKGLNQKLYYTNYVKYPLISKMKCLFFGFDLFLKAMEEILEKNSLVFWSKR